jgi:hypothetical protein
VTNPSTSGMDCGATCIGNHCPVRDAERQAGPERA